MSGPVRFGILGCGGIGRWHGRMIRSLPGLELACVADTDESRSARMARSFRVATRSPEELLEGRDVEVVCVCTPPSTHAPLIEAAARHAKHVLVEKPMTLDLAEADRVISLCERRGVLLGVVHQHRARSATRALRALIAGGALGKLRMASVIHTWRRAAPDAGPDSWRGVVEMGGGVLLDQAVHAIDLLVWFLGRPLWASGSTAARDDGPAGEDTVVAALGFDGGALATLATSQATNRRRDDIAIEVAGSLGWFRLEIRDYDHAEITGLELARSEARRAEALSSAAIESLIRGQDGSWRRGPRSLPWRGLSLFAGKERGAHPFRSVRGLARRRADIVAQRETREPQGHAAILAAMAEAVRGRGHPIVSGRDARWSIAAIDALRRSRIEAGRQIDLDSVAIS
ncbi:MAG: Gfo/Idh/MocA family protein [Gemmatimonadota bacterium]